MTTTEIAEATIEELQSRLEQFNIAADSDYGVSGTYADQADEISFEILRQNYYS